MKAVLLVKCLLYLFKSRTWGNRWRKSIKNTLYFLFIRLFLLLIAFTMAIRDFFLKIFWCPGMRVVSHLCPHLSPGCKAAHEAPSVTDRVDVCGRWIHSGFHRHGGSGGSYGHRMEREGPAGGRGDIPLPTQGPVAVVDFLHHASTRKQD